MVPEVIEHAKLGRRSTRALDLVGVNVNNHRKFSMRFIGNFVKARYKGQLVGLQFVSVKYATEVKQRLAFFLVELRHHEVLETIGVTPIGVSLFVLSEDCAQGSLFLLLGNWRVLLALV